MSEPIKIGLLGASGIAPTAVIEPARTNPDVEIAAIAARDPQRASEYATEHGIARIHESYQDLIADPELDAVYIGLPNSEHAEWTVRANAAGKHVLVEKPFTSNAAQAERVRSELGDGVVMVAYHYRYHALVSALAGLIAEGTIGELTHLDSVFDAEIKPTNIRYQSELAGGALMDLGCYSLHLIRTLVGQEPTVVSAQAVPAADPAIDESLSAELAFDNGVTASLSCSMNAPRRKSATITGTRGRIEVDNFVHPQLGNTVHIVNGERDETIEIPLAPSSYAAQLTVFVNAIRHGGEVITGVDDSVAMMAAIDEIYRATGLGPRQGA